MAATTTTVAPAPAPVPAEVEADVPRQVGGRSLDETASLFGSFAAGIALGWLLHERLIATNGWIGWLVMSYGFSLLLYTVVSYLGNPATEVRDRLATVLIATAAVIVMTVLALLVGYTFWRGHEALAHMNFFTGDLSDAGPLDPLSKGGVVHAIAGTLFMIAIAVIITVPLGIGCAIYLTEVGGRGSRVVRTVVESMTALPSIVAGLFILVTVILYLGLPRSGLAAALAISVMMLPIIARASEVVLRVVPRELREASFALGASQWRTVWRVVLPTARPGLTTAVILGTARGLGETSPVLLTAGYTTYLNLNATEGPMVSLPLLTFSLSRSPEEVEILRAFGAASILLAMVLIMFAVARAVVSTNKGGR
ncbi:MAG TPA: phosphate ABC transporter permease PstA [Nocardioidaceae bacterium]|nr:phosphate ABC transporter permease PstA [Nocardioidaceae bacterium]